MAHEPYGHVMLKTKNLLLLNFCSLFNTANCDGDENVKIFPEGTEINSENKSIHTQITDGQSG